MPKKYYIEDPIKKKRIRNSKLELKILMDDMLETNIPE